MLALTICSALALAEPLPDTPPTPRFEVSDTVHIERAASDVFAVGESVHVDAVVGNNAFLAGDRVEVDSPIHGSLFAAGETLSIDAPVHGNVYATGGDVRVGPEGRVEGHLRAASGELLIAGPVHGSINTGAGRVVIQSEVGGDVRVEAGELVVGPGGHIHGDLTYITPDEASDVSASTEGEVDWAEREPADEDDADDEDEGAAWMGWALWTGWSFISKLIVGTVLLLLGGAAAGRVGRVLRERPVQALGRGLVGLVLVPMASLVACCLVIPLPLGVLGFLLFGTLLYVGQIIAAQALGDEILRRFRPGALGRPVVSMGVGLLPLVLLASLPWVGGLVWLLATMLGAGSLWLWSRELNAA